MPLSSAVWSPDGKRIVTAYDDNTVRTWLLDIPTLQQALGAATTDCLTSEQRQTYLDESESEARMGNGACERTHGRTPFDADVKGPSPVSAP